MKKVYKLIVILFIAIFLTRFISFNSEPKIYVEIAIAICMIIFIMRQHTIQIGLVRLIVICIPLLHIANVYKNYFSIVYFLTVVLGIIFFLKTIVNKKSLLLSLNEIFLILFVIYTGLSLLWGFEFRESSKQYFGLLLAMMYVLIIPRSGINKKIISFIERDLIIFGVTLSILGILQIVFGEMFYPRLYFENIITSTILPTQSDMLLLREGVRSVRAVGTFYNPLEFGIYLLLPFLLSLNKYLKKPSFRWGIVTFLVTAGIFCTFSKGTYILTILGSILLFTMYFKFSIKRISLITLLLIFVSFTIVKLFSPVILTAKNMFILNQGDDIVTNMRYTYWRQSFTIIMDAPILGQGYASSGYTKLAEPGFDPHSSYLGILINQGIVGFILFVCYLGLTFSQYLTLCYTETGTMKVFLVLFMLYLVSFMIDGMMLVAPYIYLFPLAIMTYFIQNKNRTCTKKHTSLLQI